MMVLMKMFSNSISLRIVLHCGPYRWWWRTCDGSDDNCDGACDDNCDGGIDNDVDYGSNYTHGYNDGEG